MPPISLAAIPLLLLLIASPTIAQSNNTSQQESTQASKQQTQQEKQQEAQQQQKLGDQYFSENQFEPAGKAYQRSLDLWTTLGNRSKQGTLLLKLAQTDEVLARYPEALDHYQQAQVIFSNLKKPIEISGTHSGIGIIYLRIGKYAQAIDAFQKALKIFPESSVAMNGLGLAHSYLGEYDIALKHYSDALKIRKEANLFLPYAATLLNVGVVYERMAKYPQALNSYQHALTIFDRHQYPAGRISALNEIGKIYNLRNQSNRALNSFQKALQISLEFPYPRGRGNALENIGLTYQTLGESAQALEFYYKTLAVRRSTGDREGEAFVLAHIAETLDQKQDFELAIIFYKQSVSVYESIRTDLRQLPSEQQASYTKTIEGSYRNLADLLLKRDRILEAQQVLDLLKVQELNNYLKTVRSTSQPLENLPPEVEILKKYNTLQSSAIALGQELATLRQTPEQSRTPQQQQRIAQLIQLEEELNQQFNEFTQRPDIQELLNALSPKVRTQTIDTADLDALRSDLKQLNAVLIYPLILDDRLELIITTPDAPPLRRTVNVKREDLNRAIQDFRYALQTQESHPEQQAQQLYNWLIKPLEADLQSSHPTTLLYAPDAQLRYIPLAALHDGKQWLAQRYAINHITAKSLTRFTRQPNPTPKILAGAIGGEASSVSVGTRSFDFKGLPYTLKEVDSIQTIQPTTQPLKGHNFTLANLKPKLADYNILHLATHAALVPGTPENSFILFGGKTTATLKDIETWSLSNFDLVVLSACETGLGGNFGKGGEEILGLGYQFQNRGAKATIASLWQVDDGGTQQLMAEFYSALKSGKSKNQSLQAAQLALISGRSIAPSKTRSDLEPHYTGNPPKTSVNPIPGKSEHNLSHPYYWAPFILIGNGL
jgi:CHAT domain-containing protein/Tfp pilus assembly protein PilF